MLQTNFMQLLFSLEPQENKTALYEGLKKAALTILCLWDGLSKHISPPPP